MRAFTAKLAGILIDRRVDVLTHRRGGFAASGRRREYGK
jgi:hypothetical protein